ncbi:hypothetical protein [Streptomyces sp. A0592]|nr:hypothetical protein [Streptomyces sp. A0592]
MTPRLRIGGDEARPTPMGHETHHPDTETGPVPLDGPRAELEQFRRELA